MPTAAEASQARRAARRAEKAGDDTQKVVRPTAPEGSAEANSIARQTQRLSERAAERAASAPPPPQDFTETVLGGLSALGQGGTFGFADEIGSGIYAAGKSALTDETFDDVYDRAMGYNKANREGFADENPVSSIGLNIAGALPMAIQSAPMLARQGTRIAPKVLANSPFTRSLIGYTGLGATEGGLAGLGTADTLQEGVENLPKNMTTGAAFGAGGKVAGDLLGKGYNALTRRRVAQDLGSGDSFVPLGQAVGDENSWLKGYSDNIEQIWGSKIPAQKEKLLQRIRPTLTKTVRNAERASQLAKEKAAEQTQRVNVSRTNKYRSDIDKADAAAFAGRKQVGESVETQLTQIDEIADAGKRAELESFQRQAIRAGEPSVLSKKAEEALLTANPQQAAEVLRGEWKNGFQVVKGRNFNLDPEKITKDALKEIDVRGLDDYSAGILNTLKGKLKNATAGNIKGVDLMEARNTFRIAINEMKDKGASAQQREAFSRVASSIDDAIEGELDAVGKKVFREELASWGNYQTMRGATGRAAARKQGFFEPSDWISEKKLAQGRKVQEGTAPLQPEAMQAQRSIDTLDKGLPVSKRKVAQYKEDATEQIKDTLTGSKKELTAAKEAVENKAKLARKPALGPEEMGMGYNAAKEAAENLGPVPDIGNIFKQRAYSSVVPTPEPLGWGGKMLGVFGAGRAGSTEGMQRALAGQTGWQEAAQKLGEEAPTQAIIDALRRTALLNREQ